MRNATIFMMAMVSLVAPCQRLTAGGPAPVEEVKSDVLDVVPAIASAVIAVRNASELATRGDEFIDKTNINVPMRFTSGFRFLLSILGIEKGVNKEGAFVFMAVDAKAIESLVLAVPIKDFEAMATNFAISREQLVEGKVIDLARFQRKNGGSFIRYVALRNKHLFVGLSEKIVKLAATGSRLRGILPEEVAQTLAKDDILVYARNDVINDVLRGQDGIIDALAQSIAGQQDEAAKIEASQEIKLLTIGIRLDDGVGATLMLDFEGERSKEYLTKLATGNTTASLAGIPGGKILAAQTFSSRGEEMAVMAQSLFDVALNGFVTASGDYMSFGHRSNIADLLGLGWKSCDETRVALYENHDPASNGWFSLIAVLDTDGAEEFVQDMVDLAPYMHASRLTVTDVEETLDAATIDGLIADLGHNSFRRRRLAALKLSMAGAPALPALQKAFDSSDSEIRARTRSIAQQIHRSMAAEREGLLEKDMLRRLRPQLTYLAKQETRSGRPVDFVRLGLRSENAKIVARMQRLLGPQWNTIRVATVENKVILLVGSDLSLFESALEIALADDDHNKVADQFAAFEERAAPQRSGELHLSLARLRQLVDDKIDPMERKDKATSTTSLDLLISPQRIRVDVFAPYEDVNAVAKELGW